MCELWRCSTRVCTSFLTLSCTWRGMAPDPYAEWLDAGMSSDETEMSMSEGSLSWDVITKILDAEATAEITDLEERKETKEQQLAECVTAYRETVDRLREKIRPKSRRLERRSPTSDRGQRLEREVAELYDRLEDARDRFLREKRELEVDIVEIERELAEVRRSSETVEEVIERLLD